MTDVEKGVETVSAVPMETMEAWTIPDGKSFTGWSLKTAVESEEDFLPLDEQTVGVVITPTEDMDIYAQWFAQGD